MSEQQINRKYAQYQQLLSGLQKKDPRLYDILKLITADIKEVLDIVDPIQTTVGQIAAAQITPPSPADLFLGTISDLAITFVWSSSDVNVRFYELRKGTTWETADFVLRTSSLSAAINPVVKGVHTYLLKTLSGSLVESETALSVELDVDQPQSPAVTSETVDNNVLLYWTVPPSDFAIDHYIVEKDDVAFAELSGNFLSKFELLSGTYIYTVKAVDIAGNVGEPGSISVAVRQPPDYTLLDRRVIDWSLGTIVAGIVEDGYLYVPINLSETYQEHFDDRSYADPQDQIDDGLGYYIQSGSAAASYSEEHDYGTVLTNVIINYNLLEEALPETSTMTVLLKTYYKVSSGDSWTGPLTGKSVFIPSFRYLLSVIEASAVDDDALTRLSSYTIVIDVKKESDSGYKDLLASDSTGTVITFSKTFKDVDSIVCTSDSSAPITIIVDFVDAPNPTSFKALAYDSAGRRVDQTIYWIARGIT